LLNICWINQSIIIRFLLTALTTGVGEDEGKKEPSYTVGGM
jgi:hypothetical protein